MVKINFLYKLFPKYKNVGWILSRKIKNSFKKKVLKGIKRQYSCIRYRNFSKEDKKRENMVANIVTTSLKMKNKGKLSAGKTIQKCGQIRTD